VHEHLGAEVDVLQAGAVEYAVGVGVGEEVSMAVIDLEGSARASTSRR
jgi:hypothetical protein